MACQITVDFERAKALKELYDYCGTNCTQFYTYLTTVIKNINSDGAFEFTPDFIKEWKSKTPLDIQTTPGAELRDAIISFFNDKYPSARDGVRKTSSYDKIKTFGYTSINAREEGKRHFFNKMITIFHKNENMGVEKVTKNLKDYYIKNARIAFMRILAKELAGITGIDVKIIRSNLKHLNNAAYVNSILEGHESKVNMQLKNLIALYTEFMTTDIGNGINPREGFIKEVMYDSRLNDIRLDQKESEDDVITQGAQEEDNIEDGTFDGTTLTKDAEYDTSIQTLNNKLGLTTTFMTHLGAPIRALLGSLPKMVNSSNPNADPILDLDNNFGIADVMDADLCATVLYHDGRYDNPAEMMKSIKSIARNKPGFASFNKLHEILSNNINLQIEFFRTFRKTVISKLETVVKDGKVETRISNSGVNRLTSLTFDYMNAIKSTALSITPEFNKQELGRTLMRINSYNPLDDVSGKELRDIADEIAKQLKAFYPSIDELTIRNFILLNEENGIVDTKKNMTDLCTIIDTTIQGAISTQYNFRERETALANAYKHNRDIKNKKEVGSVPEDINPLYAKKYIDTKSEAAATQLAKNLLPYTLVSTPLNSRNVHGNQSSDVINSSMLTHIKEVLQSELNTYVKEKNIHGIEELKWNPNSPIVQLGKHRFQSKQYNFSNILLEHKDEKGKIINYGLFKAVIADNGSVEYVPTDYSTNLLQVHLYAGASNLDANGNVLYSEMTKGDYIGTAWRNFFKSTNTIGKGECADYFMRIPSDAPKTFAITAPRYSVKGLLNIANASEIDKQITNFINNVSALTLDKLDYVRHRDYPVIVRKHSRYLNLNSFVQHLETINGGTVDIKIPANRQRKLKSDKTNNIRIAFRYSNSESDQNKDNVYVMEGTYYDGVLHNAKFVGFKANSIDEVNTNIWSDIRSTIWANKNRMSSSTGGLKWNIDVNHPIFKQFKQVFMQELTDMATAATVMFEITTDGKTRNKRIKVDDAGRPILAKKSDVVRGNNDHNGLHPIYHFADPNEDGKGAIFTVDENGVAHATGKVFTSDRFILYDYFAKDGEEPIKDYGKTILDEAFALFKTRKTDANLTLQFDKQGNVILTDAQQKVIEKRLKEFILDYIEHARKRMESFNSFVTTEDEQLDVNTNNLAEFILNTHLAYVGFNDLFEGDTKFYKNTQTFLKRAKESQGSGVPYGLVDITKPVQPGHNVIPSPLDNEGFGIQMYDTFSAITIYNTVRTDVNMLETLVGQLTNEKVMGKKVLTEDAARTLLYGPVKLDKDGKPVIKNGQVVRKGGYQDTTINDAQSYITFEEWVRRITARGQLPKYKDLITRIQDENTPLDVSDLEAFIQVQKNFYYDQYYNEKTKTISPRQIKNAEFVLVPRLIAGTELEKIYQLMNKLGVDQLNTSETSKAAQSEKFTIWDENGHIDQNIIDDLDNPDSDYKSEIMIRGAQAKEYYNYNYLYTQQETPQHINSENKAGIQIMKKIIDNIDDNSPKELKDAKEAFFNLYVANIRDSFNHFMDRFNVPLDDNGNIKLNPDGSIYAKYDKDGNLIEGIDYKQFFDALQEELVRLGLDSNMVDYCTIDLKAAVPTQTIMPNYMSLVASKFENIVQSLFNHNITRQTLPGFHAAQITGMGFRKLSDQVSDKLTSNELQYHPQLYKHKTKNEEITEKEYDRLTPEEQANYEKGRVAHYIEIKLPAANFGFNRNSPRYKGLSKEEQDALMLKDLQNAGLDEIIGYRIPTEGKQSVCCMKVVGFTDDAYGSTIVVPDAWVSQTGSDFDIDSVYGIQYATTFDEEGRIQKVKYHNKDWFEKNSRKAWYSYVARHIGGPIIGITDEEFEEIKAKGKEDAKNEIEKLKEKDKIKQWNLYDALPDGAIKVIKKSHAEFKKTYGIANTKELFDYQLQTVQEDLLSYIKEDKTLSEKDIEKINEYIEYWSHVRKGEENVDYKSIKSDKIRAAIEERQNWQYKGYKRAAEREGLMSEEEYLEWATHNVEDANSRSARSNELLDSMKTMLTHVESLEENLSRSNFDDIIAALDKCITGDISTSTQRKARTAYNIFDQAEYQEDAMSGAKLKAFSVVRDTFCSICNAIKPTLENNAEINVAYSPEEYDIEVLKERFGEDNVKLSSTGDIIVTHTTFGWTNDNKNVDGKILTAYSSQTTAHILDAMKSGNVPNVNELTFQVYKTLADIGSNYDTTISFIMQPGIRRIVDAYNKTNSIYTEDRGRNFVLEAVKSILDDLGLDYTNNSKLDDLLAEVNSEYGADLEEIFGIKDYQFSVSDEVNKGVALNSKIQLQRLKGEGIFSDSTPVEDMPGNLSLNEVRLLYDLQTILTYNKIDNLANDIRTAARVCNPDKFGAKQTIFATRQVFDTIVRSVQDNKDDEIGTRFRLQVKGNHLLSEIYPGLENVESGDEALNYIIGSNNFIKDSKYKPLAAFLKYATATSIKINKTLFITQSDEFVSIITDPITGLASKLSNGNIINEKIAKEFQNYIVNYVVTQSRFLQAPLKYNMGRGFARGFDYFDYDAGKQNEDEIIRVFGYGKPVGLLVEREIEKDKGETLTVREPFTVANVKKPTEAEVNDFITLSPAQKVLWIKRHFRDAGVFKYIDVQLFNEYTTRGNLAGTQTLSFNEDDNNIETIRKEFEEAFSHTNPLIACAAADVVKYAFFVEGYRMGMKNVSKMIPNSVLLNGGKIFGTNIVAESNSKMATIDYTLRNDDDAPVADTLMENFIRSHADTIGINYYRVAKPGNRSFELTPLDQGIIQLSATTEEGKQLAEKYGITYKTKNSVAPEVNSYVRLRFDKAPILYKIIEKKINSKVSNYFLIPLNKLEVSENGEFSANLSNNIYPNQEYYNTIIDNYIRRVSEVNDEERSFRNDIFTEESKAMQKKIDDYRAKYDFRVAKKQARPLGDINKDPVFDGLRHNISSWFKTSITDGRPVKYVRNIPLGKYIIDFGVANGVTKKIQLDDGTIQTFRIWKVNPKTYVRTYTGSDANMNKPISRRDEVKTELIEVIRDIASYNSSNHYYVDPYHTDIYAIEATNEDSMDEDDGIDFSTIEDVAVQATASIYRRSHDKKDIMAGSIAKLWKEKGIRPKQAGKGTVEDYMVENHMDDIIANAAKYLETVVADIEDNLKSFHKDPETGVWYPADSIECIDAIKKDPKRRREYLKLLLSPRAIVDEFGLIKELELKSEDPTTQFYLDKIKVAVEKMQNQAIAANAYKRFAERYYDRATDNPLVKQGLISVLDGFYKTNYMNAMFNDIQETSNPIIQITMKNFQADLRAKEMAARKRASEFVSHIDEIKRRAHKAGKPFNLSNIIDEYGRFKQDYTAKLIEDRNALQKKVADNKKEFGEGSVEHLAALLEYNEWKVEHVEQPVVKDYYIEKNKLLRGALYPDTTGMTDQEIAETGIKSFPKYLAKYQMLQAEMWKLKRNHDESVQDDNYDKEMNRIERLMTAMRYSMEGNQYLQASLNNYLKKLSNINKKYFKYEEPYAFSHAVEENLRIVKSFELTGQPSNLYKDNPTYVKARRWLAKYVSVIPDYGDETDEASIKEELEQAREYFSSISEGRRAHFIPLSSEYRNKYGEFDPTLVPDDVVQKLHDEEEFLYTTGNKNPYSDKVLLSSAPKSTVFYKKEFYKGMTGGGKVKAETTTWRDTATAINKILGICYNERTNTIEWESFPRNEEDLVVQLGREYIDELKQKYASKDGTPADADVAVLKELRKLYNTLHNMQGGKKGKHRKKFIQENVDFAVNKEKYDEDLQFIDTLKKGKFRTALIDLVKDEDYKGSIVPNQFLYGYVKPKDDKLEKFIDKERTDAINTLNKYQQKVLRDEYMEAKYNARHNKSDKEYKEWYDRNHIYNPYSGCVEPISMWYHTIAKADKYKYEAKFGEKTIRDGYMTSREARENLDNYDEEEFPTAKSLQEHYFEDEDKRNPNYNPSGGHAENYIKGTGYDSNFEANEYELEAMKYMQDILAKCANTQEAEAFLKKGWLPARRRQRPNNAKGWTKEVLKTLGWTNETYNPDEWYDEVSYSKDRPAPMPMLERLKGKGYQDIPARPKKQEDESDATYEARVEAWQKKKDDIMKANLEIHRAFLDKDWVNVISEFIVRAGTYNAIQDNKYELFYAQQLIKKYGAYITAYNKKGQLRFKKNVRSGSADEAEYLRQQDENLIKQFDNQLRRILYNQFKAPNHPRLMKWMSTLQSLTSAQYMMLNVKGGIANVTLGESQIFAEAAARELFGVAHYWKSKAIYGSGMMDYALHSGDEYAGTLPGAIIKFMDVVDYDEHTGVSRLTKDAYEVLRRIRDFGYTPQTAGEHAMQNGAMFAMMLSHRLFLNPRRDEFGQPKYIYKNLAEHQRDAHENALMGILTREEQDAYRKFKDELKADASDFKEYAWYQKDVTTEFVRSYITDKKRVEEFVKKRDEINKNLEKEFEDDAKHPTVYSQLALSDEGKMTFAKDSLLAEIDNDKENGEPSDALQFMANFKGRIIAANKYIHGVYDKSGRAQFEKTWVGSLVMQYHKHLPLGIMKRYRIRGMYSEERGSVSKGMYASLWSYLSIPFRKHQTVLNLTDEEVNAGESTQKLFKNIVDFALHYKLAYRLMPEYDRANIRRMRGDIYAMLGALFLTVALKAGLGDDDDDGLLYNLCIYEADRLATEAGQYIPFIAYTEAKKLWQSPVAAGSGITDLLSSLNLLAHMILDGEDFDGEYHSGKFAGEEKLLVYLQRRIPMWRGIKSSFIDITANNKYYKIGDNLLSFLPVDKIVGLLKRL